MRKWVEISECVGKTVHKMALDYDDGFVVSFTDGTWTSVAMSRAYYEDTRSLENMAPDQAAIAALLLEAEVIDSDEHAAIKQAEEAKLKGKTEAHERAQLERLKAKYEGGG